MTPGEPRFDVAAAVPEAREIVRAAAAACWRPTRRWFRALVVHGSALTGGFVPGDSDVDLRVYLDAAAFGADGALPLDVALEIHRGLTPIDPRPFGYVQCRAVSPDVPAHARRPAAVRLIPGAYHVLAGAVPAPELTADELRDEARHTLARVPSALAALPGRLMDHGGGRLERSVRLLATDVWPTLRAALALRAPDPARVWATARDALLASIAPDDPLGVRARAFDAALRAYRAAGCPPPLGLDALQRGAEFLAAAHGATGPE